LVKAKHVHWCIIDPAKARGTKEEKLAIFKKVRDEVEKKILNFIERN